MDENPYAAPKADPTKTPEAPSSGAMISPYGPYQDISGLQKIVIGLLGLHALSSLAQLVTLVRLNQVNRLVDDDPSAPEKIDQAASLSMTIQGVSWLIFFITGVFWCVWKNKSCKNAWVFVYHEKGRNAMVSSGPTPGWAVGAYFVPILHLFRPYQAMAFIRDSVSTNFIASRLLPFWWVSWLLLGYVGSIFLFLVGKGGIGPEQDLELDELILYNESLMVDAVAYFISCVLAGVVIFQMSAGQKRKARELGLRRDVAISGP